MQSDVQPQMRASRDELWGLCGSVSQMLQAPAEFRLTWSLMWTGAGTGLLAKPSAFMAAATPPPAGLGALPAGGEPADMGLQQVHCVLKAVHSQSRCTT
jgi:hypothetical protein